MQQFVRRAARRLSRQVSMAWLQQQLVPSDIPFQRFGEGHAAWYARADSAKDTIAYCGGVGQDATFDFALADRLRMDVHSFDPTPGSIAYMARENRGRVQFHPWGMLDRDDIIRFYAPTDRRHANWFAENLHGTSEFFEAEVYSIASIMRKLGHDRIDLLKIDIEGSWHRVLSGMLDAGIRPPTVCVEFDSPAPLGRVRPIVRRLQQAGYALVRRDHENCVFVLNN